MTPEELLKEVGEPVYQVCKSDSISLSSAWIDVTEQTYNDAGLYPEYGRRILYTSDQLAAAIAKATKPLEEEVARLQEEDNLPVRYYQPNGKGLVYAVYGSSSIDFVEELRTQLAAAQEEIQKLRQDLLTSYGESEELSGQLAKAEQRVAEYNELIYAVQTKNPDETRHQTALRYIRNAENRPSNTAANGASS